MKEQHLRASNHLAEPVTRARRRCCRHGSSARCRYGERDTAVSFGERTARGSKREARVGSRVLSRLVEHVLRSHSRSHGDRKRHPALKLRRVTSRSWRHPTTELALLRAFRGMPELQRTAESAAWVPCLSMPVSMPVHTTPVRPVALPVQGLVQGLVPRQFVQGGSPHPARLMTLSTWLRNPMPCLSCSRRSHS